MKWGGGGTKSSFRYTLSKSSGFSSSGGGSSAGTDPATPRASQYENVYKLQKRERDGGGDRKREVEGLRWKEEVHY